MARIADATRTRSARACCEPGDTELDLAQRYTAAAELTCRSPAPASSTRFNHHLRDSIRNDAIDLAPRCRPGA